MLITINSHKHQTPISYYSEDITLCDSGEYACTGYDDTNGKAYGITFEPNGNGYKLKDITKIAE